MSTKAKSDLHGLKIPLPLGFSSSESLNLSPPKNRVKPLHTGFWCPVLWGIACAWPWVPARSLRGLGGLTEDTRPQVLGSRSAGKSSRLELSPRTSFSSHSRLESSLQGFPGPLSEEAEP